jgi:predicted DCC family thiol-disulfide oxidoreductase YuxK
MESERSPSAARVNVEAAANLPTRFGDFRVLVCKSDRDDRESVALVRGDVWSGEQVPVRLHSASEAAAPFDVEVFFDGECPLCTKEVGFVRRLDRRARVRFVDIAAPSFDASAVGRTHDELMARIHARLPDGELVEGVEVFRLMYAAVGFGPVVALTRIPGMKQLLDAGYTWFAKNRLRLTGRCATDACTPRESHASHPSHARGDVRV